MHRKKMKVFTKICVCIMLICLLCHCSSMEMSKTLIWTYEGMALTKGKEDALNTMLEEKGYDITVEFQGIVLDQNYYNTGELPDFSATDILSMPVETAFTSNYAEMARNEELYDWSDYLTSVAGKKLRTSMPSQVWESMKVDGKIYGLLNPDVYLNQYIVFNKELLERYHLKVSDDLSRDEFVEMLETVWEGENGRPILFAISLDYVPSSYMLTPSGYSFMGIQKDEDGWKVDWMMDIPEYRECLAQLNSFYQDGMFGYDSSILESGSFFAYIVRSYGEIGALSVVQEGYDGECQVISCKDWNKEINGGGYKTVVMKQSEKQDLAVELLTAIYTDQELSELLAYGGEIPFENRGERIYTDNNNSWTHGNLFLMRPAGNRPLSWHDDIWSVYEDSEKTEMTGFYPDLREFKEEWNKLVMVQLQHLNFYFGLSDDIEEEEAVIRAELEEAGLEKVLEELNHQLQEFIAEKE